MSSIVAPIILVEVALQKGVSKVKRKEDAMSEPNMAYNDQENATERKINFEK